ncbi:MAG: hypothetical protein ABIQ15_09905 [Nocardioides sp.]
MTEIATRAPERRRGAGDSRVFGGALLTLTALLVLNSVVGPLLTGVIDYPISESMTNQLLGLEVVTLLLVVPWTAAAGVLALRGDPRAPLLALGPTTYAAYMFVQYVVGPEYAAASWTVLLDVGLVALSGGLALTAWSRAWVAPVPQTSDRWRRRGGLALLGLAGFVLSRYLPLLVGAAGHEPIAAEFREARTFYWSIVLLDLGAVVPLTVAAAVSLLRGSDAGRRAVYGVLGWFALVPPSVAAMAAVMVARDDPHASVPTLALLSVATITFWAVAWLAFRGLVRR